MDWKKEAVCDLKSRADLRRAVENLGERIAIVGEEMEGCAAPEWDRVAGRGGTVRGDERLLGLMDERERLMECRRLAKRRLALIERGMGALEGRQRRVLEALYCGGAGPDKLAMELNMDRSSVYRLRDEALRGYVRGMSGVEG